LTPHRHYQLTVQENNHPVEPVMTTTERPCPMDLERYLLDVSQIKASDIACWKQVPDYDVFKFLLKDGRKFEVSGQAIAFWQMTSLD
jgi:hypothetical protein